MRDKRNSVPSREAAADSNRFSATATKHENERAAAA
eukprot:CAMPEP_0175977080 /NCGR_PEP_ID=MMETSP0108-20121206/44879_1 /TAXON_ID=195067 ORGANISM="Goniomonas pacifica, Strain CCMP1869" /NCGR_SAMPLE_ID=MMETSP0108 /ASSEMBLY_ACC=CAM_ASM_000204 /LENGTH=35 /DNA_ID= /DNA_START= /DNA_END= /DNA_ORIENTATION=